MSLSNSKWLTNAEGVLNNSGNPSGNIYSKYNFGTTTATSPVYTLPVYNLLRNVQVLVPASYHAIQYSYFAPWDPTNKLTDDEVLPFGDRNVPLNYLSGGKCISLGDMTGVGQWKDEHSIAAFVLDSIYGQVAYPTQFKYDPSQVRIHYGFTFLSGHDYSQQSPLDSGALKVSLIEMDNNSDVLNSPEYSPNTMCTVNIYQPFNYTSQDRGTSGFTPGINNWNIIDIATPLESSSTSRVINGFKVTYHSPDIDAPNAYIGSPYLCAFGENEQDLFDSFNPSNLTMY